MMASETADDLGMRLLGDIQRLELKPGDRFVLSTERQLSAETAERIQAAWRSFVGGDDEQLKLLILDQGLKLSVMRCED